MSSENYENRYVAAPRPVIRETLFPGTEEWITIDGCEKKTYETCAPLAMVVDKKAQLKSVGVYRHWKGTSRDPKKDKELFNTPELILLNKPNPIQSKADFLKEFTVHRCIHGIAYQYGLFTVSRNISASPAAIWNVLPEFVSYETTGKFYKASTTAEMFKRIWFDRGGEGEFTIEPQDILFRSMGNATNILVPQSPLTKIRTELSNIIAAMAYRNVILRKKGAIGILSGDQRDGDGTKALDKQEFERMEKEYQRSWGLFHKQMKVLMAKYPMKWTPMTYPTKDLMLFEEVDNNLMKVIDLFQMNAELFSFIKGSTLAESGGRMLQAERSVYKNLIIPESDDDMQAMSEFLGLHKRGEYITLDYSHVEALQDNIDLASQVMERRIRAFVSMLALENKVSYDAALELAGLKAA